MLLGERGDLAQVHQLQHRIGRRLRPDHPRVGLERRLERLHVVEVDEGEIQPR